MTSSAIFLCLFLCFAVVFALRRLYAPEVTVPKPGSYMHDLNAIRHSLASAVTYLDVFVIRQQISDLADKYKNRSDIIEVCYMLEKHRVEILRSIRSKPDFETEYDYEFNK